jgi:DNA-binding transcriptional ArsR family regulator
VFIAAEGAGGLHRRAEAWQVARQRGDDPLDAIRFLPEAVNFLDPRERDRARRTIDTLAEPPSLIVVDTMARTMVGGDENAARDVGLFVDAIDALRNETDSAALVVHHTGKSGDDERGSSALRGAADLMAVLKPDGASVRLECTKAKDSEPFDPWTLHLESVEESCVLRLGSNRDQISEAERKILETLPAAFGSDPAPAGKLLAASDVPERSYYRALQSLTQRGFLHSEESGRSATRSPTQATRHDYCQRLPTTASRTPGLLPPPPAP